MIGGRSGWMTAVLLLTVVVSTHAGANKTDSIVAIQADRYDRTVSFGTGFFWGDGGNILTAYHVVQNAYAIYVTVDGKTRDAVEVVAWAPGHDLALLRVLDRQPSADTPSLAPGTGLGPPFSLDLPLKLIGHPAGWTRVYHLQGELVQTGFVPSTSIRDLQQRDLFAKTINLLPLDVTVYGGLSGAPVLARGQVLGVISGSLNEGRSITWAIPIEHTSELVAVGKLPSAVTWPPLRLMIGGNLTRGMNVSRKKPDETWAFHLGAAGNVNESFSLDEFALRLQILRDNYKRGVAWGLDLSAHSYRYDRRLPAPAGFGEQTDAVYKPLAFFNGFAVRKHYGRRHRPYYGLSAGLPPNVQVRAGFNLFAMFNLELRGLWCRTKEKSIAFNYYGKAVESDHDVDVKRITLGINLELR